MIRDFIAIDSEMSQRALSQRAWHRVMQSCQVVSALRSYILFFLFLFCSFIIYVYFCNV